MAQRAGWRRWLPGWLGQFSTTTLATVLAGVIIAALGIGAVTVFVDGGGTTTTTTTTTTATPTTTTTTTTTLPTTTTTRVVGAVFVSANSANGADFVADADGTYRFTMRSGSRYCTAPNLCRNVTRGYDNQPVSFGGSPIPEPVGYQYTLGCFQDQTCADQPSTVLTVRAGRYVRWVIVEDQNSFGNNTGEIVLDVIRLS